MYSIINCMQIFQDKEHEQKSIPPPPPVPLIDPKSSSVVVWHEKEDLHNRVIDSKTSVSDNKTRDCHNAEENPPPLPTSPPPPWRSRYPPVIVQHEEQPTNIIYVPEPGVASQTRVNRPSSLSPAFEQGMNTVRVIVPFILMLPCKEC